MDADIRILSTDLTEALESYIERRLHFSLGRFGSPPIEMARRSSM
jgi:hypothetical protein